MMKRIAVTALMFAGICLGAWADVNGKWPGQLDMGAAGKLAIIFNFSTNAEGQPTCTMDSPDQGAYGIPATVDFMSPDSVAVSVQQIAMTYRAHVDGNTMVGTFKQGFYGFPLTLHKKEPAPESEDIDVAMTYETRELTFTNPADGTILCGTLCLPEGYSEGDKVTTVVMVTGSGQQNRDEELFGHKPFAVIADHLAKNGIASFRYDDRGVNCSGGNAVDVTLESNLADALAAIAMVKALPETGKVGLLGHSEGGLIGYMAANRIGGPQFVVSIAGPAIQGDSIVILQNRHALAKSNFPEKETNQFCRVLRGVLNLEENATHEDIQAILHREDVQLPTALTGALDAFLKPEMKWMRSFARYNPATDLKYLHIPVFLLNGEKDTQVYADINVETFRKLVPPSLGTAKIYPSLNHLMQHCTTGEVGEYGLIDETIAPEVLDDIASWINGLK